MAQSRVRSTTNAQQVLRRSFPRADPFAGFRPAADGSWQADIPDVADGKWYFVQFVVDGVRAVRAKTPNKLYDIMGETVEVPVEGESGEFRRSTEILVSSLEPLKRA